MFCLKTKLSTSTVKQNNYTYLVPIDFIMRYYFIKMNNRSQDDVDMLLFINHYSFKIIL